MNKSTMIAVGTAIAKAVAVFDLWFGGWIVFCTGSPSRGQPTVSVYGSKKRVVS